jgi:hypothetical protein
MNELAQNIAVFTLVAAAALYVASRAWRLIVRRKTGSCGPCGGCGAKDAQPLVNIERFPRE